MNIPIDRATLTYECSQELKISRHPIRSPELRTFYFKLKGLLRGLGEERTAEYWTRFLGPLQRYRFNLCSAPLPFSYLGNDSEKFITTLHARVSNCSSRYPDFADPAGQVIEALKAVISRNENAILGEVKRVAASGGRIGLLLASLRNFDRTSEILKQSGVRNVELVSLTQLRRNIEFDSLIYIGSTSWLKSGQYVFSAPRSKRIHLIYYSWLRAEVGSGAVFLGPTIIGRRKVLSDPEDAQAEDADFEDIEAFPKIDLQGVLQRAARNSSGQERHDLSKARLYTLSEGVGVFLEADSDAPILVIDRSEESSRLVRSVPVQLVRPGMHVILRTSEGGDYILPVANRLLGDKMESLRKAQADWKQLLRDRVKKLGMLSACVAILDCGSTIANEVNLRNWLSPRSIRTQKKSEFDAIMKFIGLEEGKDEKWDQMRTISWAHRRAGHLVRREILGRLNRASIDKLEQRGRLDVELPEIDAGRLTAFHVDGVSEQVVEVPFSRLATPFNLEEALWQE